MIINSILFVLFFVLFSVPYFFSKGSVKIQNIWVLFASYIFYGWTDWRMVGLLLAATVVFYGLSLTITRKDENTRKTLLLIGTVFGVGMLLYFKYMNFFTEQFAATLGLFGINTNWSSFNIVVPIGISFFTFKLISYIVNI